MCECKLQEDDNMKIFYSVLSLQWIEAFTMQISCIFCFEYQ